jgi:hypothetical protein
MSSTSSSSRESGARDFRARSQWHSGESGFLPWQNAQSLTQLEVEWVLRDEAGRMEKDAAAPAVFDPHVGEGLHGGRVYS